MATTTALKPNKLTSIHYKHLALGAKMVDENGWQRPSAYTSPEREVKVVRASVGVCDISPVGKIDIQGKDVGRLLEAVFSNCNARQVGRASKLALPNTGSVAGNELLVCRLCGDQVLMVTPTDKVETIEQTLTENIKAMGGCVHLTSLTSALAAVKLVGPSSCKVLSKLTSLDLRPGSFPDLSCAQGDLAKVHAVIVRADVGAEPGYDLYFGRDYGEHVWDSIMRAGREFNIAPFGLEALKILSL